MEEAVVSAASPSAPPLPPKTKLRSASPPFGDRATAKTVSSVSFVDVFHSSEKDVKSIDGSHVVKILISPRNGIARSRASTTSTALNCADEVSACTRISVNGDGADMVADHQDAAPFFYYGPFMTSGQVSPSDTLDSGTCSDLDGTPPPSTLNKKNGCVSVTLIGSHKRAPSSSSGAEVDSDDNESSISCDSLNSGKVSPLRNAEPSKTSFLPQTLLQDIRQRNSKLCPSESGVIVDEKSYEERQKELIAEKNAATTINADLFYNFHINETCERVTDVPCVVEDETFAGYKDILGDGASTIRSAKGTVRGVRNRVRAGIATFLQINTTGKNFKEKEAGKVVVYTTTMGVLRDTYQACTKVKQILRTLLVKFEERDVFMSSEYQAEIRERMRCDHILVPQVFVDGQHVGDAETVERLNETGELRKILKPFQSMDVCTTCKMCGGYRLLPCQSCNGSKKSVHRNHFTAEFVALKCMNCDEVGLVRCNSCS